MVHSPASAPSSSSVRGPSIDASSSRVSAVHMLTESSGYQCFTNGSGFCVCVNCLCVSCMCVSCVCVSSLWPLSTCVGASDKNVLYQSAIDINTLDTLPRAASGKNPFHGKVCTCMCTRVLLDQRHTHTHTHTQRSTHTACACVHIRIQKYVFIYA